MTSTMVAVAVAVAKAAADAIAVGDAYTVTVELPATAEVLSFTGAYYDALGMAKDFIRNPGFGTVELTAPDGKTYGADSIVDFRY